MVMIERSDAVASGPDGAEAGGPPATLQTFRERLPRAGLERYVTCVWIQQVFSDSGPYMHRTVPNGSIELVCELGSVPTIVGPQTEPTEEMLAPGTTVVGVRLRPGAGPAVLGMPASELVDLVLRSDELWGRSSMQLAEKVAAAAGPEQAAALLEAEVGARLTEQPQLDPVVAEAVRRLLPAERTEVGAVASSLYLSERQLRRRCETAIGLTPKVLQRMLRFQGFLALTQQDESPSRALARLAREAGYADQSHLVRESVRLAGRTPRTLLREAEHHCRGAHDHLASHRPLLPVTTP